ncbi:MAG: ABC transporter ATP-binding protein [Spirochaetales bacterium]|nr:ABC transporter ATP-binding protein [Spirochaetales bacterium]
MSDRTKLEDMTFTGNFSGKTIGRILKLTLPHWKLLAGFSICIALTALTEAAGTYLTKWIIDKGILAQDYRALINLSLLHLGFFAATALFVFGFIYYAGRLGQLLQFDLREQLFNHLQELSFSFFDRNSSGWLLSRVTSDSRRIAELASWMLLDIIWATFNILFSLIFMGTINVKLALLMLIIVPLLALAAIKFKSYIIKEFRKVRSINSRITSAYSENINGVRIVKALTREGENARIFGNLTGEMYQASFRAAWLSGLFLPLVQLITSLALGIILLYGGWQISLGGMTIGGFRAFIAFIAFMIWPIQDLARVFSEMQQAIASAERVFALMDREPDIKDEPDAKERASFRGKIEFRSVDFHYVPEAPILSRFNLTIPAGETLAIVGPTGGGKTTLASLISRYYEPTGGTVLLDGTDYRQYTQKALQSRIGVVLQTPHLFSGTVRENIMYGRPDATEEEVLSASKRAHAHRMILELPGGYEEQVGEEGTLLSVGQKQLISLARTILANPDIIIMDEATSSVDTMTEQCIQQGMEELLRDRTSVIIAHRLSTIRNADRIIVIQKGEVTEEGNHRELLKRKGHYNHLYTSQFRKENSSSMLA